MPPTVANYFKIQQTPLSRSGPGFRAANGSPIKHLGQRVLKGWGDNFQSLSLTAQVAEVSTTLGSVNQMLKAGNRVHFEAGNSYIEHVRTGRRTKIEEKNGTFEVGVWVPRASSGSNAAGDYNVGTIAAGSRQERASFQGQDGAM